jgi:hypothetical protein
MNRIVATLRSVVGILALVGLGACAGARPQPAMPEPAEREPAAPVLSEEQPAANGLAEMMARAHATVPARPDLAQPSTVEGTRVWRDAVLGSGLRILVSTEARSLWLMRDTLVVLSAPVAVGMGEGFVYQGKRYDFSTPISRRRVRAKETEPIWVPPDWHYYEIAVQRKLQAVQLRQGQRVTLADGSRLEVRGRDVGRVNQFGNFYAFEPGAEMIFDGNVYIPPFGTRQRQVPEVLGTHRLILGDGYLIHGTNQETSIGDAVSHGCIRMFNADVEELFGLVPVGTPVFIY